VSTDPGHAKLIAFGRVAEDKDALETQMILNHKQALEFLITNAGEIGFDTYGTSA
jgi:hypothetical protein